MSKAFHFYTMLPMKVEDSMWPKYQKETERFTMTYQSNFDILVQKDILHAAFHHTL